MSIIPFFCKKNSIKNLYIAVFHVFTKNKKVKKHPKMAKNILDFCNAGIARVSEDFFAKKFCNIKNIKNIKAKNRNL